MGDRSAPDPVWPRARTAALVAGGAFIALYLAGALLDAPFLWGVNTLGYLPTAAWLTLALASALLLHPSPPDRLLAALESPFNAGKRSFAAVVVAVAAASVAVMSHWKISTDIYGDTRKLVEYLNAHEYTLADLLNLGEEKEPLTRMIHQKVSRLTGLDITATFQALSCLAGGLAIGASMLFARGMKADNTWKAALVLGVMTSGINQVYFGHVEDYALPALCSTLVLLLGWRLLEGGKTLVPLLAAFATGLLLHLMTVVYLPAVAYAVYRSRGNRAAGAGRVPGAGVLPALVGASLVAAFLAYVFVFGAWELPDYSSKARLETVFLPVVNPLPAPHSYALLSPAHLSDVVQELLYVTSPLAIVAAAVALASRRLVPWKRPEVPFLGLAFFYQLLFTATVDPVLSISRDWDLLSQVALPGTLLGLALLRPVLGRLGDARQRRAVVGAAVAPAILASAIFYVNADADSISKRIRSVGEWTYASYWIGSSYVINVGEKMIPDPAEEIRARLRTIERIRPLRSPVDRELCFLQYKLALRYFTLGDYVESERWFEAALQSDSGFLTSEKFLAQNRLLLWKFGEAEESIARYNDLVNTPDVSDFNGLIVAQFTNQIVYLRRMGADSSQIGAVLSSMSDRILKGEIP